MLEINRYGPNRTCDEVSRTSLSTVKPRETRLASSSHGGEEQGLTGAPYALTKQCLVTEYDATSPVKEVRESH